jgi:hypothetical protein
VDVTLIVFFTIFGAVLLAAFAYVAADYLKGQVRDMHHEDEEAVANPVSRKSVEFDDE